MPASIDLRSIDSEALPGAAAVVGLLDEPEIQVQRPFQLDLESGHVCIAGSSNSGKTTALLAIAEAFAARNDPAALHIYGIDFGGGGLAPLELLPHCGGVAGQHQPPAVQWVLQALKDIVAERLSAPERNEQARVLVLVDNFTGFWSTLGDSDGGQDQSNDLVRLLDIGRAVGVTFAVALERPDGMRPSVLGLMETRLALPMSDAEAYSAFGLLKAKQNADPISGRAIIAGRLPHEMQFGLPSRLLGDHEWPPVPAHGGPLPIAPLPDVIEHRQLLAAVPALPDGALLLGLRDGTSPLFLHPAGEHLLVLVSRRSGRSNTLAVSLAELQRNGVRRAFIFNRGARPSCARAPPLREGACYVERADEIASIRPVHCRSSRGVRTLRGARDAPAPGAIVIDDADALDIPSDAVEFCSRFSCCGRA